MNELKIGDTDSCGRKVDKILYYQEYSHVVYFTNDDFWGVYFCIHEKCQYNIDSINKLLAEIHALMLSFQPGDYADEIALSINQCLIGNTKTAIEILSNVKLAIINFQEQKMREHYLLGSMLMLVISFSTAAFPIPFLKDPIELQLFEQPLNYGIFDICASMGAFISTIISSPSIKYDLYKPRYYYSFIAMIRMVFAYCASIIVFLAIKANIIFSFAISNPYAIYLIAATAGFSQNFAISILNKMESQA